MVTTPFSIPPPSTSSIAKERARCELGQLAFASHERMSRLEARARQECLEGASISSFRRVVRLHPPLDCMVQRVIRNEQVAGQLASREWRGDGHYFAGWCGLQTSAAAPPPGCSYRVEVVRCGATVLQRRFLQLVQPSIAYGLSARSDLLCDCAKLHANTRTYRIGIPRNSYLMYVDLPRLHTAHTYHLSQRQRPNSKAIPNKQRPEVHAHGG